MTLSAALIWNAASIALGVIAIVGFLWAKPWDRAKGRLRCPKCWYDMKGAADASPEPPWTCSECGRVIATAKHLRRTRRRLIVAIPCIVALLLALYGWTARDRVIARGSIGAIPTIALAAFAPVDEWTWQTVTWRSLPPQVFSGSYHVKSAARVVFDPTPRTQPIGEHALAELVTRLGAEDASALSWRIISHRMLGPTGSPNGLLLHTRDPWPRGTEVWAYFEAPPLLHLTPRSFAIRARQVGTKEWSRSLLGNTWLVSNPSSRRSGKHISCTGLDLGIARGDSVDIEIELLVLRTRGTSRDGRAIETVVGETVVWRGVSTISAVTSDSATALMQPAWDQESMRSLQSRTLGWLKPNTDGDIELLLWTLGDQWQRPSSYAMGFRVELLRGGEIVAHGTHLHTSPNGDLPSSLCSLEWSIPQPTEAQLGDHVWEARLISDHEVALRDYRQDAYWQGTITVRVENSAFLQD